MQRDIESEVVEQRIIEISQTNSVGSASPAVVQSPLSSVQSSPARMNISQEINLSRAVRDVYLLRDKLAEVAAKDMEDEQIKRDKFLSLLC